MTLSSFPAHAPASANLIAMASPDHLQSLLSADLNRVSLLNFWAPWAAPCTQMNAVVSELSKKHPMLLVLNVDAEEQTDIAESFEVEAVPTFVLLRGHTLLARIAGADAAALTKAVAQHIVPLASLSEETPEELDARMRRLMTQTRVVLFMKGTPETPRCGFSRKMSAFLKDQGVEFSHFDILQDEPIRRGLKQLNEWPTFPQLIVNGEFVGGLDIVREMVETGEFATVFQGA